MRAIGSGGAIIAGVERSAAVASTMDGNVRRLWVRVGSFRALGCRRVFIPIYPRELLYAFISKTTVEYNSCASRSVKAASRSESTDFQCVRFELASRTWDTL